MPKEQPDAREQRAGRQDENEKDAERIGRGVYIRFADYQQQGRAQALNAEPSPPKNGHRVGNAGWRGEAPWAAANEVVRASAARRMDDFMDWIGMAAEKLEIQGCSGITALTRKKRLGAATS